MAGSRVASKVVMFALLLSCLAIDASAFNILEILKPFPNFSLLNDWLNRTGVSTEINNQTSITLLAPDNDVLQAYLSGVPNAWNDPTKIADTLRYHALLEYFGYLQLSENVLANGTSVTTLLQRTGRANDSQGFVTLYNNGTNFLAGHELVDDYGNETILANVTGLPFVYSVLQVSALLSPAPPALPSPTPAPSPLTGKAPTSPVVEIAPAVSTKSPTVANSNDGSTIGATTSLVILSIIFASVIGHSLL